MSADGPALYFSCDNGSGTLIFYSVNVTNGQLTELGNIGITNIVSMVFAQETQGLQLYATSEANDNLYILNLTNGSPTLVGNTSQDIWGMALPASTFSVVHTFTGAADGGLPFAGMITDSAGNLYGTAGAGGTGSCSYIGTTGCGTIFELKLHNGSFLFNPLYSFQGGTDGEFSVRPMTAYNGTYYGATWRRRRHVLLRRCAGVRGGFQCRIEPDTPKDPAAQIHPARYSLPLYWRLRRCDSFHHSLLR